MPTVAILTPEPDEEAAEGRWTEVYGRMLAPLAAAGIEVEARPWTGPGDLSAFPLVMPLVAWGYYHRAARWIEAVTRWEQAGVRLMNPPDVLRWNSDKRYLARLADAGAPVIPTLFVDRATPEVVADAFGRLDTDRVVVKPQISAGAYQTLRLRPGEPMVDGPAGAAMIQPYMRAIESEGETSLFFFGGDFSHAVRKAPRAGDFRVQPEWGGLISFMEAPQAAVDAATRVVSAVTEPLLYARVDLTRDDAGAWVLVELELIEPELYLDHAPDRGEMFGRAVAAALIAG